MLYYLLYHVLQKYFSPLNVFRYITVRTVYASLTAMFSRVGIWTVADPQTARTANRPIHGEEGPQDTRKKPHRQWAACSS